jgi:hypothetical protein
VWSARSLRSLDAALCAPPLLTALEGMDSKAVNREIRGRIWPLLKDVGFSASTARTSWRHSADSVDVVNFQSFNKYNADVLGVTTFSFAVNLGTYLRYIPPQWPPKRVKEELPYPEESECQFRARLKPTTSMQSGGDDTIWVIEKDGRNLSWCIQDVAQQINSALAWFERLRDKNEVLRILTEEPENMTELWGFGRNPSPSRSYLRGYVAMALGQQEVAQQELKAAVESGCFTHLFSSTKGAEARAL